jgi:hypothetical protein
VPVATVLAVELPEIMPKRRLKIRLLRRSPLYILKLRPLENR